MNKVPASVMVLGIIGIVLGALGMLGLIWSGISQFVDIFPNPMMAALRQDTGYIIGTIVSFSISVPATLLLLASSIGSLILKPWAWRGMILYSWVGIVQAILGTLFNAVYIFPKMTAAMPATATLSAGSPATMRIAMIFMSTCGLLLALIYPICVIYFFKRMRVVNAFKGIFPASTTYFPVDIASMPPAPPSPFP